MFSSPPETPPHGHPSWTASRAHARLRLLAGMVGLVGTALIVALLIMGGVAHG